MLVALLAAAVVAGCSGSVQVDDNDGDHAARSTVAPNDEVSEAAADPQDFGGCGNGVCTPNESCASCPQDCGACSLCAHATCSTGDALDEGCDPCVAQICAVDSFCCDAMWDALCVAEVGSVCGTPCAAACGDGMCNGGEDCTSCSQDCGACPVICGDGTCGPSESCATCSQDCGVCPGCGNGVCTPNESCGSCPQDCGACPCAHSLCSAGEALDDSCGPCVTQICAVDPFCCDYSWDFLCVSEVGSVCGAPCPASCGDGMCSAGEDCTSCSQDCGQCPVCGDGWCSWPEDCSTCDQDCGPCPTCGDGWCDWNEDCSTCAQDCGACPFCGNGQCDQGEDCASCSGDCGVCPGCPMVDLGSGAPQTVSGSTAGLVNGLPSPCAYSSAPEVTYSFTAAAAGTYELNTFGSAYDTILHVHDGTCQGPSLACNDDTAGLQSKVTVDLAAGQTIIVAVDGFGSSQGAFTLHLCDGACAPACGDGTCNPGEDCSTCSQDCGWCPVCGDGWCDQGEDCAGCASDCGACPVCGNGQCEPSEDCASCSGDCGVCPPCPMTDLGSAVPQTVNGSTSGLIDALPSPCAYSQSPEATYSFTAPADGTYEFNTIGSAYDTILHVHDGTCQGPALECNDDSSGLQSKVFVDLTAGQTVIVVVDGFGSASGAFTLNVL